MKTLKDKAKMYAEWYADRFYCDGRVLKKETITKLILQAMEDAYKMGQGEPSDEEE